MNFRKNFERSRMVRRYRHRLPARVGRSGPVEAADGARGSYCELVQESRQGDLVWAWMPFLQRVDPRIGEWKPAKRMAPEPIWGDTVATSWQWTRWQWSNSTAAGSY